MACSHLSWARAWVYSYAEHWRLSHRLTVGYALTGSKGLPGMTFNGRYERIVAKCNGKPVYQIDTTSI